MTKLKPIHPGEILREEFMEPLNLNPSKLATALRVTAPNVYAIVNERGGISSDMAMRLGRFFGTTAEFWMNLQAHYELSITRQENEEQINNDVRPLKAMMA